MSNQSKTVTLSRDEVDDKNKMSRDISAIEIGGGVLVITTTKQLDPVSNTYKIITESSTFLPESYISELSADKFEIRKK